MSYTFLAAAGHDVGDSLVDETQIDGLSGAARLGPPDTPAQRHRRSRAWRHIRMRLLGGSRCRSCGVDIPAGWQGLDIGPATVESFAREIGKAGTVLWNGPMGVFEDARFNAGTAGVARAVAESAAFTVVGGGDSAAAVDELGLIGPDQLHLHRWRGLARAPRIRRPPRSGRIEASGQRPTSQEPSVPTGDRRPSPPATDQWQLEDEPRPPRSPPRCPRSRTPAATVRRQPGRRLACTHRSPISALCSRSSSPRGYRWRSAPRIVPSRTRGPSPAR